MPCLLGPSAPNLSSLQLSHRPPTRRWKRPGWSEYHRLPSSVVNLALDCCRIQEFNRTFEVSSNVLQITVTTDPRQFNLISPNDIEHISTSGSTSTLFPNVTHLKLNSREQAYQLLLSMDFPSVTHVEVVHVSGSSRIQPDSTDYTWLMRRLSTLQCLESLILPAKHKDMVWNFNDGSGDMSAALFEAKGIGVLFK